MLHGTSWCNLDLLLGKLLNIPSFDANKARAKDKI